MSHLDLRPLRTILHIPRGAYGANLLLADMQRRFIGRGGTEASSCQSGKEASYLLRPQQREARFGSGPRMEIRSFPTGQLHVSRMRASRGKVERRPYQALRRIPRIAIRCLQRANVVRSVPPQDPNVRLARVLAQASRVKIAAKRLAQEVLPL